jgi:hypothetical protein
VEQPEKTSVAQADRIITIAFINLYCKVEAERKRDNGVKAPSGRNSKLQVPNTKEAPNIKLQPVGKTIAFQALRLEFWRLEFGASLEIGSWDLELYSA